jgi:CMP/dCMP kinase
MKKIIAIDGHSSTGKSTLAKQIAKHYAYVYVDTGAMYRSIALAAIRNHFITNGIVNKAGLIELLPSLELAFKWNPESTQSEIHLNGENVETFIRSMDVSQAVSLIASIAEVRSKLVEQQQKMGAQGGLVMDGRDIGTVVFPNADVKLFMTASAKTRAQRRFDELTAKGQQVTFDEIYENVTERDFLDSTRAVSPLIKADDAIEIDNSELTREAQFDLAISIIEANFKNK